MAPAPFVTAAPTPAEPEQKELQASWKATCQGSDRPAHDVSTCVIRG